MPHLRDGVSEKPLEGLLLRHPHVVHQVDLTRLRQRRRHGNVPVPNQVRRPQMARPPRDGAVQKHLAIRRRHGSGEGVECLGSEMDSWACPSSGCGHTAFPVPWPGGLVEPDPCHFFGHAQIHDRRHAPRPKIAERLLRGLARNEHVIAYANELRLEEASRIEGHSVPAPAPSLALADNAPFGHRPEQQKKTPSATAAAERNRI